MIRQPRQKNDAHLGFIRGLSCLICLDNTSTEAAHVRMSSPRAGKRSVGAGEKPDDKWTIPLCNEHHRAQHAENEREFWMRLGINPVFVSLALWAASGNHDLGEAIVREHSELVLVQQMRGTTAWSG
jgi:hypothetical protein